jgi:hypothetical protein
VATWGLVLGVILLQCLAILSLNSGMLVYALDDPYIHLAMAENLLRGHYGVNLGEYSSPSSSVIWPLLLAPFMVLPHAEYVPLVINTASTLAVVVVFWRILSLSMGRRTVPTALLASHMVLAILGTNAIGLVLLGMEHSVQLFLAVAALHGMILIVETGRCPWWLPVVVAAGPLIRYENLSVSVATLLFLFVHGHRRMAVLIGGAIAAALAAFSVFLLSLGLGALPTSVVAKTSVVTGDRLAHLVGNLKASLVQPRGVLLICALLSLVCFIALADRRREERLLAGAVSLAIAAHVVVGQYGWANRYEIYVWAVALWTLVYVYRDALLDPDRPPARALALVAVEALGVGLLCAPYLSNLVTSPTAANNIYEQHYQMHRFATTYWGKPVAVNDLGYVAYRNDAYVLDLGGLASRQVLDMIRQARQPRQPASVWMDELTRARVTDVVMIYDESFDSVPPAWIKLGRLHLSRRRVSPTHATVNFYATRPDAVPEATVAIAQFRSSLPAEVTFVTALPR